jgi:hypothetical protein
LPGDRFRAPFAFDLTGSWSYKVIREMARKHGGAESPSVEWIDLDMNGIFLKQMNWCSDRKRAGGLT